jgi:N-acetylglucosaminylphosphatidylinositol deacetylase
MQDGPSQEWKVEILSSHIIHYTESLDIDLIITFDKNGISNHANHCAIYHAAAALCLHQILPSSKFYWMSF